LKKVAVKKRGGRGRNGGGRPSSQRRGRATKKEGPAFFPGEKTGLNTPPLQKKGAPPHVHYKKPPAPPHFFARRRRYSHPPVPGGDGPGSNPAGPHSSEPTRKIRVYLCADGIDHEAVDTGTGGRRF